MTAVLPYRLSPTGLSLFVRVTPNAGRDAIEGTELRDDGSAVLRLRVKAVPDKGRANAAVIALLAKALGVPKSAITLTSGEAARVKTLSVAGDGAALVAAVESLR
ncbi:MAG: hypothetical protein JWQ65_1599 [Devosia sp.]|nr:hypothetical protein [Devosia sp.]